MLGAYLLVVAATVGAAQAPTQPAAPPPAPAPAQAAPPPGQPAGAPQPPPQPAEPYSYKPEGRRDPFLSLVGGVGGERGTAGKRGVDGLAGLATSEISVRGVMISRGAYVAMVLGADGKTYIVHANDKLADGTVKSVTAQGLVIVQAVNDPLSLVKQREIRKLLRGVEEGK